MGRASRSKSINQSPDCCSTMLSGTVVELNLLKQRAKGIKVIDLE